jgi:hypothetical protein
MLRSLRDEISTAADKYAKSQVAYEHPAAKSNHCGICRHFIRPRAARPATCEIVRGNIRAEDWCERFARKEVSDA